jgi:hypothetical protein
MNKRTEKAIEHWLELPRYLRSGSVSIIDGEVSLFKWLAPEDDESFPKNIEIARFALASVINKRGPARKNNKRAK